MPIKTILLMVCVAAVIGFLGFIYYKGGEDKKNKIENHSLKQAVDIRETQNEIRNRRPDNPRLSYVMRENLY